MKHLTITILFLSTFFCLKGQHIHLQTYTSINRTSYTLTELRTSDTYLNYGARLAIGLPKLQIGGELERQLNDPAFANDSLGLEERFNSNYAGGFLRWNISKYPAHRFGLVVKAGGGIQNTTRQVFD